MNDSKVNFSFIQKCTKCPNIFFYKSQYYQVDMTMSILYFFCCFLLHHCNLVLLFLCMGNKHYIQKAINQTLNALINDQVFLKTMNHY